MNSTSRFSRASRETNEARFKSLPTNSPVGGVSRPSVAMLRRFFRGRRSHGHVRGVFGVDLSRSGVPTWPLARPALSWSAHAPRSTEVLTPRGGSYGEAATLSSRCRVSSLRSRCAWTRRASRWFAVRRPCGSLRGEAAHRCSARRSTLSRLMARSTPVRCWYRMRSRSRS